MRCRQRQPCRVLHAAPAVCLCERMEHKAQGVLAAVMLTAAGEEVLPGCVYSMCVPEVARLACWCGASAPLAAAVHAVK